MYAQFCEFCQQEETLEHVMLYSQKCDADRRELILNLKEVKVNSGLQDLLHRISGEKCYLLCFSSKKNKFDRDNVIVFIIIYLFLFLFF